MNDLDITIELTDLAEKMLCALTQEPALGDDTIVLELIRRERSLFLTCPISRTVLDGMVETVECLLDGTLYCKDCARMMANNNEKCWVCNLMSFKEMIELSQSM
jgi:hypothetical protein